MSTASGVNIDELPVELKKQLGIYKRSNKKPFTAEHERRYALKALALLADLEQSQRGRVLRRALKINDV